MLRLPVVQKLGELLKPHRRRSEVATGSSLSLRSAALSDVGIVRSNNEDSAYAGSALIAVADGVGGHAYGEVASSVAITTLAALDGDIAGEELVYTLANSAQAANERMADMIVERPELHGMGTTLTALLCSTGNRLGVVHIGDSRAYRLRDGALRQLTTDHTLVQSLVSAGKISAEEAAADPRRSLILRALDGCGAAHFDLSVFRVVPGDRYLVCSDGVSDVLTEEEITEKLSVGSSADAVASLVASALEAGSSDNVTCVVADAVEGHPEPSTAPVSVGAVEDWHG
ncbi:PP2C family protein-serine/threonine phosphatase [Haloechinothrix halophila]|uniref:PP2C family protein-serine/threonine phosphatase n=1 Tax=Haloechinothrix halophila TaxID=1069073 RepID=UPI0003F78B6B|nr:protein phosphatase 2C domain-containing protein [Haloechinothrix halophila]